MCGWSLAANFLPVHGCVGVTRRGTTSHNKAQLVRRARESVAFQLELKQRLLQNVNSGGTLSRRAEIALSQDAAARCGCASEVVLDG